jgi:hypothetical protein
MRLTKSRLRRIIKEEARKLNENRAVDELKDLIQRARLKADELAADPAFEYYPERDAIVKLDKHLGEALQQARKAKLASGR